RMLPAHAGAFLDGSSRFAPRCKAPCTDARFTLAQEMQFPRGHCDVLAATGLPRPVRGRAAARAEGQALMRELRGFNSPMFRGQRTVLSTLIGVAALGLSIAVP